MQSGAGRSHAGRDADNRRGCSAKGGAVGDPYDAPIDRARAGVGIGCIQDQDSAVRLRPSGTRRAAKGGIHGQGLAARYLEEAVRGAIDLDGPARGDAAGSHCAEGGASAIEDDLIRAGPQRSIASHRQGTGCHGNVAGEGVACIAEEQGASPGLRRRETARAAHQAAQRQSGNDIRSGDCGGTKGGRSRDRRCSREVHAVAVVIVNHECLRPDAQGAQPCRLILRLDEIRCERGCQPARSDRRRAGTGDSVTVAKGGILRTGILRSDRRTPRSAGAVGVEKIAGKAATREVHGRSTRPRHVSDKGGGRGHVDRSRVTGEISVNRHGSQLGGDKAAQSRGDDVQRPAASDRSGDQKVRTRIGGRLSASDGIEGDPGSSDGQSSGQCGGGGIRDVLNGRSARGYRDVVGIRAPPAGEGCAFGVEDQARTCAAQGDPRRADRIECPASGAANQHETSALDVQIRAGAQSICHGSLIENQTTRTQLGDGHRIAGVRRHPVEGDVRDRINRHRARARAESGRSADTQRLAREPRHREGRARRLREVADLHLGELGTIEVDRGTRRDADVIPHHHRIAGGRHRIRFRLVEHRAGDSAIDRLIQAAVAQDFPRAADALHEVHPNIVQTRRERHGVLAICDTFRTVVIDDEDAVDKEPAAVVGSRAKVIHSAQGDADFPKPLGGEPVAQRRNPIIIQVGVDPGAGRGIRIIETAGIPESHRIHIRKHPPGNTRDLRSDGRQFKRAARERHIPRTQRIGPGRHIRGERAGADRGRAGAQAVRGQRELPVADLSQGIRIRREAGGKDQRIDAGHADPAAAGPERHRPGGGKTAGRAQSRPIAYRHAIERVTEIVVRADDERPSSDGDRPEQRPAVIRAQSQRSRAARLEREPRSPHDHGIDRCRGIGRHHASRDRQLIRCRQRAQREAGAEHDRVRDPVSTEIDRPDGSRTKRQVVPRRDSARQRVGTPVVGIQPGNPVANDAGCGVSIPSDRRSTDCAGTHQSQRGGKHQPRRETPDKIRRELGTFAGVTCGFTHKCLTG